MKRIDLSLSSATLFALFSISILQAASVTGTVVDDTGKPINKARVSIHLRAGSNMLVHPSSAAAEGRTQTWRAFNGSTQSDSRGGFAFANVPAGVIQVCVQTAIRLQFDPCLCNHKANYFEFHATQDVNLPAARDVNKPRGSLAEDVKVSLRSPVLGFIPLKPKVQG